MMSESIYWRRDLYRASSDIRSIPKQKSWTEATSYRLERAVLWGAMNVRRMAELGKIPDQMIHEAVVGAHVPRTDYEIERFAAAPPLDVQYANRFYDFERATRKDVSVGNLVNQVVHSFYLFMDGLHDPDGLHVVFIASDNTFQKGLTAFSLQELGHIFERVSLTEPAGAVLGQWVDGRYKREVLGGRLSDRLVGWGLVSEEMFQESVQRLGEPASLTPIHEAVRQLGRELRGVW